MRTPPMNRWIVLPFDDSVVARAALRRVARVARQGTAGQTAIMLAMAGADPAVLDVLLARARADAGADLELGGVLLAAADPCTALDQVVSHLPYATVAVPIGPFIEASWYTHVVRHALTHPTRLCYALHLDAVELQAVARHAGAPAGSGQPGRAVRRVVARLAPAFGMQTREVPR